MVSSARNRNHIVQRSAKVTVNALDGTSQWQRKYGTRSDASRQDQLVEDRSIIDWIASVRDTAETETDVSTLYFDHLVIPNNSPVDKSAFNIISRMNKLIDGTGSQLNNVSCKDHSDHRAFDEMDDFDVESFGKYLQVSNFQCDPLIDTFVSMEENKEDCSGENMAFLFRRTRDDQIARKCINYLLSQTRENRVVRGRVFSQWKTIARDVSESKDAHVRRFHRRLRLRILRHLLSTWVKVTRDGNVRVQRATQMKSSRAKFSVLASWRKLLQQRKTRRHHDIEFFSKRKSTKLKRALLIDWLAITWRRRLLPTLECDTNQGNAPCVDITTDDTTLTPSTVTSVHMTPNVKHTHNLMTAPQKEISPQLLRSCDKEKRPTHKLLELPLKRKSQKRHQNNTPTPKLVLEMNQRKQDREKSRMILRQRYEQQAIEKRNRRTEELRKRDEEAMTVQREFFERRSAEEHRKKLATSRWKQAYCLAAMHRRLSLQKRMLHQWKKIFQINSFNKKKVRDSCCATSPLAKVDELTRLILFDKALLAWSDTTYEKCWKSWLLFMKLQQIERNEINVVHQQLAGKAASSSGVELLYVIVLMLVALEPPR